MSLWDALCIHACYHNWNPISLILRGVGPFWIGPARTSRTFGNASRFC